MLMEATMIIQMIEERKLDSVLVWLTVERRFAGKSLCFCFVLFRLGTYISFALYRIECRVVKLAAAAA